MAKMKAIGTVQGVRQTRVPRPDIPGDTGVRGVVSIAPGEEFDPSEFGMSDDEVKAMQEAGLVKPADAPEPPPPGPPPPGAQINRDNDGAPRGPASGLTSAPSSDEVGERARRGGEATGTRIAADEDHKESPAQPADAGPTAPDERVRLEETRVARRPR